MTLPTGLHISTYNDRWHHPLDRYAVHQRGTGMQTFRTLADAKAWVQETFTTVTEWKRREVPDGGGLRREWWPKGTEPEE